MKSLPLIFAGVFATVAFSWSGLLLTSQIQYGKLTPYEGPAGGVPGADVIRYPYPSPKGGAQAAGRDEYIRLGCIYCHTQQVRPAELFEIVKGYERHKQEYDANGAPIPLPEGVRDGDLKLGEDGKPIPIPKGDIARGFGPRNTVARDYIMQDRVLLGTMRTGPDLANVGARTSADWHLNHMYDPQLTSPGSNMPPFRFLYKKVVAATAPARALTLSAQYRAEHGLAANEHIVPTERVDNLIAYLMSLKIGPSLPEAKIKE